MNTVNKPFRKKDAMQLVTGQPVYMDDLVPADCLIVKLLRSPHANAIVKSINTAVAKKVPGIEAIFTWEDVPQDARRYTQAGQTYPEASPYDRLLIDRHVRFVGDVVAIVAGKDDKCVDKALKMIKVEYEVLEPVLDYHTAKDNPILVHPEDNWESLCPVGGDNKRNLCALIRDESPELGGFVLQTLQRGHFMAIRAGRENGAGQHRLVVEEDRAEAAVGRLTAPLDAQTAVAAHEVDEQSVRGHVGGKLFIVQCKCYLHGVLLSLPDDRRRVSSARRPDGGGIRHRREDCFRS